MKTVKILYPSWHGVVKAETRCTDTGADPCHPLDFIPLYHSPLAVHASVHQDKREAHISNSGHTSNWAEFIKRHSKVQRFSNCSLFSRI